MATRLASIVGFFRRRQKLEKDLDAEIRYHIE